MVTRKTSKVLKNEYGNSLEEVKKLENKITDKLLFYCNHYPDAPLQYLSISRVENIIRASSLIGGRTYVETIPIPTRLQYLEMIEIFIGEQQGLQLNLFEQGKIN